METNLIIMHFPTRIKLIPDIDQKLRQFHFVRHFQAFRGPKIIPKRTNFYGGSKFLFQIIHLTINNMHAKLLSMSYYFLFYHPQRHEKCQTEKISFKNRVVIFLFMLIHYLHNTA